MKSNPAANQPGPALPADSIDRLLEAHLASPAEQLTPSSGFALSVMDAIRPRDTGPPPIPFPWRCVLPGAIAILCALAAFLLFVFARHSAGPAFAPGPRAHLLASSTFTYNEIVLGSVILAACVSVAAVAASFRLAGRSR